MPRVDTVERLLHAYGLELDVQPRAGAGVDEAVPFSWMGVPDLLLIDEVDLTLVMSSRGEIPG